MFDEESDDGWDDYDDTPYEPTKGVSANRHAERREEERRQNARLAKANGNLFVIIFFSLVIVADAIVQSDSKDVDPAAAVAISLVAIIMSAVKYCHSVCIDEAQSPSFEVCFGVALLILWVIGVILLTVNPDGTFFNVATSGFFATWVCLMTAGYYVTAVCGNASENTSGSGFCGLMNFKKGVTPTLGVAILLTIGLIAASISGQQGDNAARALISTIMLCPMLLGLILMICLPLKFYGDPDNFLIVVTIMIIFTTVIVAMTTMSAPFAVRGDEDEAENVVGSPFELVGVGFFTAMGLFGTLAVMMWNSHRMILIFNLDNGEDKGVQGRYIWLSFLGISSGLLVIASIVECGEFEGCDGNRYLGPALGLSVITFVFFPVLYCVCKTNEDQGDLLLMDPEQEGEYFSNNYQRLEFLGSFLLQVAWLAAAGAITFPSESPFAQASAGFFFTWFSFAFATLYFNAVCPRLGLLNLKCLQFAPPNGMKPRNNFGLALVVFGTIVQAVSAGVICIEKIEDGGCEIEEYIAFGINAFIFFFALFLLLITPQKLGICALVFSYILVFMCFGQLVVTTIILGPFVDVQGNGFFAAWVSTYGAYYNIKHYEWKFVEV